MGKTRDFLQHCVVERRFLSFLLAVATTYKYFVRPNKFTVDKKGTNNVPMISAG